MATADLKMFNTLARGCGVRQRARSKAGFGLVTVNIWFSSMCDALQPFDQRALPQRWAFGTSCCPSPRGAGLTSWREV